MENKQTAVEWLVEQIDNKDMGEIPIWIYEFIEQAKAMEKEQIIDAYFSAIKSTGEGWNGEYAQGNSPNIKEKFQKEFEKYYASTFNS